MLGSYSNGFAPRDYQPRHPSLWTGCIGAWAPCLGPTGDVLRDWSGAQRHGTLTTMDPGTDWVTTRGRWALDFDGSNDHVACGTVDSGSIYTISAWAIYNDTNSRAVVSNYNLAANRVQYDLRSSTNRFEIFYQNASGFRSGMGPSTLTAGTLNHIVWVNAANSDAGQSLYYNGVPQTITFSNSGSPDVPTSGFGTTSIGRTGAAAAAFWNGIILDVMIFQRAWSHQQVQLAYRGGPGSAFEPSIRRSYVEPVVEGPFVVEAGQVWTPSTVTGEVWCPGTVVVGEVWSPGTEVGEVGCL